MGRTSRRVAALAALTSQLVVSVAGTGASEKPPFAPAVIEHEVWSALGAQPGPAVYVVIALEPPPASLSGAGRLQHIADTQSAVLSSVSAASFTLVYRYQTFAAITGWVQDAALQQLAAHPKVDRVGLDIMGRAHLDDSVPFITADDVHMAGWTGDGVTIAVLDTGVDSDHPDLAGNIAPGAYHFLNLGADVGPGAEDDNGHGTNVAGIITSQGAIAPPGVAPDADILPIKVIDANSIGWLSDWAAGVDYVVQHKNDYDNLCAVNMSLGSFALFGECPCDGAGVSNVVLGAALQAAQQAGIITFASSGNAGSCGTMASPACLSGAAAVAAVYDQDLGREPNQGTYQTLFGGSFGDCFDNQTSGDRVTCFSNRSPCNLLAAPGRLISAPGMGGGLSLFTGTSQAAPHCAALAALMAQKCAATGGSITGLQMIQTMMDTGLPTVDDCGSAPHPIRVNALAAVSTVCQSTCEGDLTGNGVVDAEDLGQFLGAWGAAPGHPADLNGDGVIDAFDLGRLLGAWGPCA